MRNTKRKYVKEHAEFCVYLRKLRQNYGYTQTDIAKTLNLSRSQYTRNSVEFVERRQSSFYE